MTAARLVALLFAASLGGCASGSIGASGVDPIVPFVEPTGKTLQRRMRIEGVSKGSPTRGVVNTLYLYADGTALSRSFKGDMAVLGRWVRRGEDLCFTWPVRGRECWFDAAAVQTAQIVTIVSDRGVVARFTGY